MNISRRHFVRNGTFALAGASLFSRLPFSPAPAGHVLGLQLYSVRDDMKKDPLGTLKQLAAAGYKNVEHASYKDRKFYNYGPAEFKKVLDGLGLKMVSGHTVFKVEYYDSSTKDFTSDWKYTVEDALTAGQHFVISPWLDEKMRTNYDDLVRFLDLFNKCGAYCKKSGIQFGYHNHDFEFSNSLNGKQIYDIILANTDPKLVAQQLDMGNMYGAGGRALDIIKKHPGRFVSMHVKDEIKSEKSDAADKYESTILGKGILPVKQIIDAGKKSGGTTMFIIEQESYQQKTPLQAVAQDYTVMKSWGY